MKNKKKIDGSNPIFKSFLVDYEIFFNFFPNESEKFVE